MDALQTLLLSFNDGHFSVIILYHGDYTQNDVCCTWPRNKITHLAAMGGNVPYFNGEVVNDELSNYILNMQIGIVSRHIFMCGGDARMRRKEVFQIENGTWRRWSKDEVINKMCPTGSIPTWSADFSLLVFQFSFDLMKSNVMINNEVPLSFTPPFTMSDR